MYKIIIVDDDVEVREGMKEIIEWNLHGFELIGDYSNGSEALEAISDNKPDLVLSDICMPFMDGIELTRQIGLNYPYIKVIILTGYDDFDYAQQALRLKAYDFIVKPITAHEIHHLLDRVRIDMDEETKNREDLSQLKKQLQQSLPLLKERFLEQLINRTLPHEEIQDKFHYFRLPFISPPYLVIAIDIDGVDESRRSRWENDPELLRYAAFNIVEEVLGGASAIIFRTREERIVAIFSGEAEEALHEAVVGLSEAICFSVEKYLKFTVTVGIGTPCRTLRDLPLSYKGAVSALDYRFLLGNNQVISISDMESSVSSAQQLDIEWSRKFTTFIKTGTLRDAEHLIGVLLDNMRASYLPVGACYLQIQTIIIAMVNTMHELVGNNITSFHGHRLLLRNINDFHTLDEIGKWLMEICSEAISFISEQRNDLTNMQVQSVIEFIEQNYADEELSLQDICRHVHMSKSYLSSVFKQHTDHTIMEYVTRTRVEKAKELLQHTMLKSYEIANKVGYSDPQYFSVLFKKNTGTTPTEFRERLIRERTS